MRAALAWLCTCFCALLAADPAAAQDAGALRARYERLRDRLEHNDFGRPLHLESAQSASALKGDIHAVLEQRYAAAAQALRDANQWCEILIVHINVKYCRAGERGPGTVLVMIGRKFDQPLTDAYEVAFAFEPAVEASDYLRVAMRAAEGPMGTKNYTIALEAAPLDAERTFIHLSYSYGYGTAARIAMQAYLATLGRDKVGFSVAERRPDGTPSYVGGVRGVVERNTMRYFLAIEAYLGALGVPAGERTEKRLRDWYAATERHPLQLHEIARDEYLQMKRNELRRQQAGSGPSGR